MRLKKETTLRSYIIAFNNYADDRDKVIRILDEHRLRIWRSEIPGCVMLNTINTAKEVRDILVSQMNGRFIVAEISGNRSGMMTMDCWDFLSSSRKAKVVYEE